MINNHQTDELAQIRAEMAELRAANKELRTEIAELKLDKASQSQTLSTSQTPTSRRRMLKGMAVAGLTMGAAVGLNLPQAAQAADGGNLIIGQSNIGTATTTLSNATTSNRSTFTVNDNSTTLSTSNFNSAIAAQSDGFSGVVGYTGSILGELTLNQTVKSGVLGVGGILNSYGVAASLDNGSTTDGLAQVFIRPHTGVGAPTTGAHKVGELYVDSTGALFYCVTINPLAFRKIAGPTTTGATHLLPVPDRYVDTRPAPLNLGGVVGPLVPGQDYHFTIAGATGRDGFVAPQTILAVVGNVTAISPTGPNGFIKILPDLTLSSRGTSTLNFNSGVNTANSFNCALVGGKLQITVFNATSVHIAIDIVGYLF